MSGLSIFVLISKLCVWPDWLSWEGIEASPCRRNITDLEDRYVGSNWLASPGPPAAAAAFKAANFALHIASNSGNYMLLQVHRVWML